MTQSSNNLLLAGGALVMGLVFVGAGLAITHSLFKPVEYEHVSGPILAILYVPPFGAIGGLLVAYATSSTVLPETHSAAKIAIYPLSGVLGVSPQVYYMIAFADQRYANEVSQLMDWLLVGIVLGLLPALYVGYQLERS